jgi:hypothetical protein
VVVGALRDGPEHVVLGEPIRRRCGLSGVTTRGGGWASSHGVARCHHHSAQLGVLMVDYTAALGAGGLVGEARRSRVAHKPLDIRRALPLWLTRRVASVERVLLALLGKALCGVATLACPDVKAEPTAGPPNEGVRSVRVDRVHPCACVFNFLLLVLQSGGGTAAPQATLARG